MPGESTLHGGTAIALQLGHRRSVDFDFFGAKRLDAGSLPDRIPFLEDAEVLQRQPNTVT